MTNVNQMDLVSNGFIRDFQAARRNLIANGNPNSGEPTGNFGRLYGGRSRRARTPTSRTTTWACRRMRWTVERKASGSRRLDCRTTSSGRTLSSTSRVWMTCSSSSTTRCRSSSRNGSAGFAFAANYTHHDRAMTCPTTRGAGTELVVPSDPKRLDPTTADSDFDIRHVVRGHFIWDLPIGQGRRFMSGASGLVNALVGGWQVNGILDASSGFPFTVYSGYHTFTFYDSGTRVATTSASGVTNRADYTGSGSMGRCVGRSAASSSSRPRSGRCSKRQRRARQAPREISSPVRGSSRWIWGSSRAFRSAKAARSSVSRSSTSSTR
jgi:hypothetical protein